LPWPWTQVPNNIAKNLLWDWKMYQILQVIKWKIQVSFSNRLVKHLTTIAIHNSIRQQISQKTKIRLFLYFYQIYRVQQFIIKASLVLGFMIQLKAKTSNNIFLIPYLGSTPFVTSCNVLPTYLNLNNKSPMSSNLYYTFKLKSKFWC